LKSEGKEQERVKERGRKARRRKKEEKKGCATNIFSINAPFAWRTIHVVSRHQTCKVFVSNTCFTYRKKKILISL